MFKNFIYLTLECICFQIIALTLEILFYFIVVYIYNISEKKFFDSARETE